jgi:hypothetical protein
MIPVNCQFVVDDATADWNFGPKFDFIHTRTITFGISDWDRLVEQAFDSLNPGGWIELQEFCLPFCCDDGSMSEDHGLGKWSLEMHCATVKVGINSLSALEHSTTIRKRGFVNIDETLLKVPLGPWAKGKREKKIGLIAQKDIYDCIEGASAKPLFLLGHNQESVTELIDGAKADIMDPDVSAY